MQKQPKKIVIIGPESTGKSTLTSALAAHLQTNFATEHARDYLAERGNSYAFEDLKQIAEGQIAAEEFAARTANNFLLCDTDLYVLFVWSMHKYGKTDPFILRNIATRFYDAYILCDIDMPWQADPQREHPEAHTRRYFFSWYKDLMVHSGRPFIIVSGNEEQRLAQALASGLFTVEKPA